MDSAKSLVHFGIKVSLKVGVQICAISDKLTLHQFAFQAALFSLFTVALCLYLIKVSCFNKGDVILVDSTKFYGVQRADHGAVKNVWFAYPDVQG